MTQEIVLKIIQISPKKGDKIEILVKKYTNILKFKVIVVFNISIGKSFLALRGTEGLFKEDLGSTMPMPLSIYFCIAKIKY